MMRRTVLLTLAVLFFCSSLEAAPPWLRAYRSQRDQMRSQLEYQQDLTNSPKQVNQQQKAWLRQQEKSLRDQMKQGAVPPHVAHPNRSQPGYPVTSHGHAGPVYKVPTHRTPAPGPQYLPTQRGNVATYGLYGRTYQSQQRPHQSAPPVYQNAAPHSYQNAAPHGYQNAPTAYQNGQPQYSVSQPNSSRPPQSYARPRTRTQATYTTGGPQFPNYNRDPHTPMLTYENNSVPANATAVQSFPANSVQEFEFIQQSAPTTSVVISEPEIHMNSPIISTSTAVPTIEAMPEPIPVPAPQPSFNRNAPSSDDGPQPTPAVRPGSSES